MASKSKFRRHGARTVPNDMLALLSRLADERGITLSGALVPTELAGTVQELVESARAPIRLHGRRAEEMFVYVAVALGKVRALKREETDEVVVADDEEIAIPDFRLVLADGTELLVEVKNLNKLEGGKPPKASYLRGLARYGTLFSRPVYIATYWPRWRTWTLTDVADLLAAVESGSVVFSFTEALSRSRMSLLGDLLLGTRPPLVIRLDVDSQIIVRRGSTSEQAVRIREVSISCAGTVINDARDKEIAFGLMQHGQWHETESLVTDGDLITAIEFRYAPPDDDARIGFAPVAALSSLASSQFNALTTADSKVTRLRPKRLPAPPYPTQDETYTGVDMPLWKLILEPGRTWAASDGAASV